MNTHEALDVLQRQTVFFSEVQEVHVSKAREAFLAEARLHVLETGEPLHQGFIETDAYFFLLEGSWRVERKVDDAPQLMFANDRVGSWTGGIDVIDAIAPVRGVATRRSTVVEVPRPVMLQLLRDSAAARRALLEALAWGAGRLHELSSLP
jgi:hypothetical protein